MPLYITEDEYDTFCQDKTGYCSEEIEKEWTFWSVLNQVIHSKGYYDVSKETGVSMRWKTKEGIIHLFEDNVHEKKQLCIYYIYVKPELRNQGVCTDFLTCAEQCTCYDEIVLCGVQSDILEKILRRRGYRSQGGDWIKETKK